MQNFGKVKLLGMVAILTVALIFVRINFLDAQVQILEKKASLAQEEATWNVTIPGPLTLEGLSCNLYGLPDTEGDNTYEDEHDRVYVSVEKKKEGKEYLLRLFIYHSVFDAQCINLPYPHQIGFQNVNLENVPHSTEGYYVVPEEFPCFFPNYEDYTEKCYPEELQPEEWWRGTGRVPGCMKHFLEEYPHPYCDIECNIYNPCSSSCPNCVYRYIDIRITVDHDIEKIEVGLSAQPTAQVWVEVVNNYDLQTGLEDWHNISGLLRRDDSTGCITITRSDTNTWEITVDTTAIDPYAFDKYFIFNEIYKGGYGKGKSWEYKIPYWTKTPFKFLTKWTRLQPTPDTTPPAGVADLATGNPTSNSIDLTWTAPGDDDMEGTASQYDIRYSTTEIDDTNWDAAAQYSGEPSPSSAGTPESFIVTGLSPNTTYYFALKTADEVPNWSVISNSPSGTTKEATTQTMHVSAINMSLKKKGAKVNAFATVIIVDALDNPVSGVTVYGTWSGATTDTDSGVTDGNGKVTFKSDMVKKPKLGTTFTFTVGNVVKTGWTYDSGANVVDSGSITYE